MAKVADGKTCPDCGERPLRHSRLGDRALADGRDVAYLADIAVLPSHQGRGLGAGVVSRLLEYCKGHRKIILYAAPGREGLYHKLGFRRMRTAMAIFADQEAAYARGYLSEI